jgi:hypothetical protein
MGRTKLTVEQVLEARLRYASGERELSKLVLQPGFTSAAGALAPVTLAGTLLMPPSPDGPVLDRLNRRRLLPHEMPEQPSHFRHGERQQPRGLPDGGFSPRWRADARW